MGKICFLMDSIFTIGGVQRVTAVIAKELAKQHDVTIVTMDQPQVEDTSMYGLNEAPLHYRYLRFPTVGKWKKRCLKVYSGLYRKLLPQTTLTSIGYSHSSFPSELRDALTAVLTADRYDVIVGVHAPLAARLSSCRSRLGDARLVGWIHNSYEALFGAGSLYIGPELRRYYEMELERLDATVVLCRADAARYPFPTQVIYNPLTLTPGRPSTGTSRKFLAVGRFSLRHKGFDILIEAFHLFAEKNKEWTLDIVGEGVEEPMYRQMIAKYGLEQRITIHPFTNNIQQYYSDAQVYVLSSRWEGFGLVLVEAMAHGLPVVSSDLPTSLELLGDFGIYFENGNARQLAERLQQATQVDWPQRSAEAMQIASKFEIQTIIGQWQSTLGL